MDLDPHLCARLLSFLPDDAWTLTALADSHNLVVRATSASDDVVLRVQPTHRVSAPAAIAIVEYLNTLSADGSVRAPRPRACPDGAYFASLERGGKAHRCSLVSWVPGVRAPDAHAFVEHGRLRAVAGVVARMHMCARESPPRAGLPRIDADALLGEAGCQTHADLRQELDASTHAGFVQARETMRAALRSRAGDPEQVGLIHADLEPQNWVFDGDRPGVIDFDELRFGPFAVDLLGVLWTHAMWDGYAELRDVLFDGYEQVRPLPPKTREEADVLMAIVFLQWLDFVYGELDATARERHRPHVRPMVERIIQWCAAGGAPL